MDKWSRYGTRKSILRKIAGTRVVTPTGVTGDTGSGPVNGGCNGDDLNAPGPVWLVNDQITEQYSSIPSDIGSVTVTIQTDTGA
jgi:hypothetical protein